MTARQEYICIIKNAILANRKNDNIYYEKHHILPKSIFPLWKYKKRNIVLLTAKEHFICHQLLTIIYPGSKMFLAYYRLCHDKKHEFISADDYESLKKEHSKLMSNKMKSLWKDPLYRKAQSIKQREGWTSNKRDQVSKQRKGNISKSKRPIICVETNKEYSSIKEARLLTNIKHITDVLLGNRITAGGYHWIYKNPELQNSVVLKQTTKQINKNARNRVLCVETGEIFKTQKEAASHINIACSTMSKMLNRKQNSIKGLTWILLPKC
jgi:stalled ribosome alternative rescue factor ArfA